MALSTAKTRPNWAAPYLALGYLAKICFEDDEAITYLKKAISTAPECITGYAELAEALRKNTDFQGCLEIVAKGLAKLGKLYNEAGSYKKTVSLIDDYLKKRPSAAQLPSNLRTG